MSARTAARRVLTVTGGALTFLAVAATVARAAPTPPPTSTPSVTPSPTNNPCDLIRGQARSYCEKGHNGGGSGAGRSTFDEPASSLDPLSSLAKGIADGAAWTVDQLSNAVKATSDVDFTSMDFVKTYALVFAASGFLTMLLWLWAVAKRAVRGVPLTRALGEAIGLLWVTVLASAFTPLVLYTVVSAVDGITQGLAGGESGTKFFEVFSAALRKDEGAGGGGPIIRIILGLISILAAGVVWLELVVRSALLYVGAVLGTVVYSGLVDRDLWGRVRKWAGMMVAIILVKPIIVIILALASALTSGQPNTATANAIISGLSIIVIAIFASTMLFRMIPGMGDEIVAARSDSYAPASRQAVAAITRPVTGVKQGISTHASRDSASYGNMGTAQQPPAPRTSAASSGISAHSVRPSRTESRPDVRRDDPPKRP
ncbi:hypothetical protein [Streptomyces sp. NPDC056549]|uniref:hypothetical protein n=1 Tax=Streptomyces sp. NPDC056549 TaxID=3345864 RepID=UPI00369893D8